MRPWRSRVLPLELLDGLRKTLTVPVSSSQRSIRSLGMSLHTKVRASPSHTGPSAQRQPVKSRSTHALRTRSRSKRLSSTSTAESGYRVTGVQAIELGPGLRRGGSRGDYDGTIRTAERFRGTHHAME